MAGWQASEGHVVARARVVEPEGHGSESTTQNSLHHRFPPAKGRKYQFRRFFQGVTKMFCGEFQKCLTSHGRC